MSNSKEDTSSLAILSKMLIAIGVAMLVVAVYSLNHTNTHHLCIVGNIATQTDWHVTTCTSVEYSSFNNIAVVEDSIKGIKMFIDLTGSYIKMEDL